MRKRGQTKVVHYHIKKENKELWLEEQAYSPEFEQKTESVFTQCNGYLGIRAVHDFKTLEENRGMFVGGVYQKACESEVTELVNCPDITELQMKINGAEVRLDRCKILKYCRSFHINTGELKIEYELELPDQTRLSIHTERFVSNADKHLVCQKISIELLNRETADGMLTTGINGQITNSGVSHFHQVDCRVYDKKYMSVNAYLNDDTLQILSCFEFNGSQETEFILKRRSIWGRYPIKLKKNNILTFTKYSIVKNLDQTTGRAEVNALKMYAGLGYEELFRQHRDSMEAIWSYARVEIAGARLEEEAALLFAQYHLLGMTPKDTDQYSVGAKGLTGEGYKGHVFWDTELFVLPFFNYTFPDIARNLLQFRYRGLDGARKKAIDYGYEGAMFPWEAAKDGYEETPLYAALNIHTGKANKVWSGVKEHHVTADIVYAVWQYYTLSKDEIFMEAHGYEIIFEAARFWVSRASYNENKQVYDILDIIGPDEYTEHIDNNTYTNYMAAFCVRLALNIIRKLEANDRLKLKKLDERLKVCGEKEKWTDFIEKIYLAVPDREGIIPQDDTFLKKKQLDNIEKYKQSHVKQAVLLDYSRDEVVDMQVLKQADTVMLLNLFPTLFVPEIVKKNVLFYESRTIHDSSLSYCAHAQACAAIGEVDLAWQFFEKAMVVDIDDNPLDTTDGIHAASLGGIWNCVIFGFAGITDESGTIICRPNLPKHWECIGFYMKTAGTYIKVTVGRKNISFVCEQELAEPMEVRSGGVSYLLKDHLMIER